ncbi:Plasma membrane-associated cation-binding protein 2 [Hirschfeldia incana]|nr:Plasma membrane-associated cation-binding protein 2 [Hirschfeldia incana]
MGYWKSRVVPTIKKMFERSPTKKVVVVEASKSLTFDDSKEAINKEIEEKRTELEAKVVEIYEATSAEFKALVREPTEDGLTKHSAEVHKFLEALVEIGFPGSKAACDTSPASSGTVIFIFEKVCLLLPAAEKSREVEVVEGFVKADETSKEEGTKNSEKELEIEEEKREEIKPIVVPAPAAVEEKKLAVEEEKKVAVEEKKPAVEEEKKAVVEEKKPALVEEKKPVEEKKAVVEEEKKAAVEEKKPDVEDKKEVVAPAPVAESPSTKVTEAPVLATPAKAPETPAAAPQKA